MTKKKKSKSLLSKADQVIDVGACGESPYRHVVLMKQGKPIGATRARHCEHGKPLPNDSEIVFCDSKDGKIVDRMRTGGPAQVATEQYRDNYDGIFGKKKSSKKLN